MERELLDSPRICRYDGCARANGVGMKTFSNLLFLSLEICK
jgi:hypothetical protein